MNSKNWKAYCQTTFNSLAANVDNWGDPDFFRPITRLFYIGVFDCAQVNHLGLISEAAKDSSSKKRTHDHCLSPQFIGRMIMDNPDKYLSDYDVFENLFWLSCSTITVTKDENKQLSLLTDNDGDYKVYVPTNLKYKHLGIKLYRKNGVYWKNAIECDDNIIPAPKDLLEYEKKFLVQNIKGPLMEFLV